MKPIDYKTPKPGVIMKFLWKAAGGDRTILERATYADQIKYLCLGGIVVSTGAMAGLAGGYAFYTIFSERGQAMDPNETQWGVSIASMLFGIIWGLIIFNIDRFIVTSTGKGDGTEKITMQEFKSAIPRIILGSIIALTISKPVEIRMFQSEIAVELEKAQQEKQNEFIQATNANFDSRLSEVRLKIQAHNAELDEVENNYAALEERYLAEMEGLGSSAGRGKGPIAKSIEAQMMRAEVLLNQTKERVMPLIEEEQSKLAKLELERELELQRGVQASHALDGLLERIKLAHKIAGPVISLFITLLFLAIELTPIFFKLMLIKSPYDYLEENVKELIKAENGIIVQYNFYEDGEGVERHLVRNLKVEKRTMDEEALLKAQRELTEYAISKYVEETKQAIDKDPSKFIQG